MAKYKFKLIGGGHVQTVNGVLKEFVHGDIIETDQNLVSMFRGKFERVHQEDVVQVSAGVPVKNMPPIPTKAEVQLASKEVQDAAKAGAADIKAEVAPVTSIRLGPDMTAMFLAAKGTGIKVHQIGEAFQVVNAGGELLNPNGNFTKAEVNIFLNNIKNA